MLNGLGKFRDNLPEEETFKLSTSQSRSTVPSDATVQSYTYSFASTWEWGFCFSLPGLWGLESLLYTRERISAALKTLNQKVFWIDLLIEKNNYPIE